MSDAEKIPFAVQIDRVLDVLAGQIYQSPLALLRENAQNSYDAILLRRRFDKTFAARIEVTITPEKIVVTDNGIGMTKAEMQRHFWHAGASSKNTPEARAAGVVGTFGIGAMANFGIASQIHVVSENVVSEKAPKSERTESFARKETLSLTKDCIEIRTLEPRGEPGTTVTASIDTAKRVAVQDAVNYLRQFVLHLPIDFVVNGALMSRVPLEDDAQRFPGATSVRIDGQRLGDVIGDVEVAISPNGEVWFDVACKKAADGERVGRLILRQGGGGLRTYRSGFGLAVTGIGSAYQLGGAADFLTLVPTAGREALTTESVQFLQNIINELDRLGSEKLAVLPQANNNTAFMSWALAHNKLDLLGKLRVRFEPNGLERSLEEVRAAGKPVRVYGGADRSLLTAVASDESPVLVLSTRHPRKSCEERYLAQFCKVLQVTDRPQVLSRRDRKTLTSAEGALLFRVGNVLESDYFLKVAPELADLSHDVPVLVERANPVQLFLDPKSSSVQTLVELYTADYQAFGGMVKDFIRTIVFPRISDLVPSSTRQGAAAFLRLIKQKRDVFEYEYGDLGSLADIWSDYQTGKLTLAQATERSKIVTARTIQVVDASAARAVRDVIPDVIDNQQVLGAQAGANGGEFEARPAVSRTDVTCDAKLLVIAATDEPLNGYRCFLAVTDRVREEKGDFFLQPHRTSIVWGGQKVLFIFQHHSGRFGLYYDLQIGAVVSAKSGGGQFQTSTIVMKDRTFIPIPPEIQDAFIPKQAERKRFEVSGDILYADSQSPSGESP